MLTWFLPVRERSLYISRESLPAIMHASTRGPQNKQAGRINHPHESRAMPDRGWTSKSGCVALQYLAI
jgi:hypothetical protein